MSGKIGKLSRSGQAKKAARSPCQNPEKKFEKSLKKGIDKRGRVWYNNKAVAKKRWQRSLKIEQQEISTKQIVSAKY